uniref:von Willebrand factor A domain containing 5B2 n=1 Tax=Sphaeramia orbicularis TaxID=375764 RepID=A0A673AMZ7_9TELE
MELQKCPLRLESPTHALRADADPSAQSASATYITLAQEHPYDRHIEIILHLSEPHSPLVILEKGRLSFSQYEQHISSRRDFIRCSRKDSEIERKLEFVRKRYHKDILSSPVLMLNFCPDLLCEPLELHKATRELLFLVDRSGSMSMLVALKSLPSGTMLNIVGFGTTIKPLFTSSRLCTDVTCRRLLQGVAKLTGGTTEFLEDEDRLQPKLIKSLKKAFEPVLTDVRIDWYLPENMEALLSPNEIPPLYPGNRLIGYCTLYDMTNFRLKKPEGYKGAYRSSTGSVFGQSNDELSPPPASELMPVVTCADGTDLEEALREISREISSEFSCARDTDTGTSPGVELDWSSDVRRRIQESSYIQEQYVLTRCSLSSEQSLQTQSHSHIQASSNSHSMPPPEQRSSLSHGLLFPASPLDWDGFTDPECLFTAAPPEDPPPGQCRSVIHGLLCGKPVSWEVTVDLGHLWAPEDQEATGLDGGAEEGRGEPWEEIIHQLTARSVIRDFEKMAEKENDAGHAIPYEGYSDQTIPALVSVAKTLGHQQSLYLSDRDDTPASPCSLTSWDSSKYCCPHPQCLGIHMLMVFPQVRLQLASGAFLLTEIYSDCVQIPLDRLKRASPYSLHRRSLNDTPSEEGSLELSVGNSQSHNHGQVDSGRGSETDVCEGSLMETAELHGSSQLALEDLEGSSWATAVALAWLEHRCAGYFMEWELVAAKADFWLRCQELPEGVDLAGLKGAARQLFLLLRHWDENIKLNMLCYNPNNM